MFDFKFVAFSILLLISFLLGYQYANNKCELELKRLETVSNEKTIEAIEKTAETTQKIQDVADKAGGNLNDIQDNIQADYNLLSNSDMFTTDWLHSDSDSKASSDLSDSATTSGSTKQETQCRCTCDNRKELSRIRKLYEAELKKAKECDLAVVQLNEIIDYYNKIRVTFSE